MEIDEFLTRIALSGAEPTIFSIYEKGKNLTPRGKELEFDRRTLKTYTKTEDATVIGYIHYDDPFPKQIFAIEPEGIKNILKESTSLKIDDSFLLGSGNIDFKWKLKILGTTKTLDLVFDNPNIPLSKELIGRIIRADSILDTSTVGISSDGKEVSITVSGKIKDNQAKIKIPFSCDPFDALYEKRFIECLKLVGNNDVMLNVDGYRPGMKKTSHGLGKIELKDETTEITYYVSEITRSVSEEKQKTKKEKSNESQQEKLPEEFSQDNDDVDHSFDEGQL